MLVARTQRQKNKGKGKPLQEREKKVTKQIMLVARTQRQKNKGKGKPREERKKNDEKGRYPRTGQKGDSDFSTE